MIGDAALLQNPSQWMTFLENPLLRRVGKESQIDLDGAKLDRLVAPVEAQDDLAKIIAVGAVATDDIEMNTATMKGFERRCHIVLVNEERAIGWRHVVWQQPIDGG